MARFALPSLTAEFEPTRATLHAYARAAGALPRAHGVPHPKWWHLSLKVRPEGLVGDPLPLPDGGALAVGMDLTRHEIVLRSSRGASAALDMQAGATGTEIGRQIIAAAADLGLEGEVDTSRFEDSEARAYHPAAATAYFDAFVAAHGVFAAHRATLGDRVSPIQVWPHGFDLAFDWFGTRMVDHEGEALPAQLNLGFYPGGEPYFYSNPWPFDPELTAIPLPHDASWHTEGWQGALLPYTTLQGDPGAAAKLTEFARAVFAAAAPTLTAP